MVQKVEQLQVSRQITLNDKPLMNVDFLYQTQTYIRNTAD